MRFVLPNSTGNEEGLSDFYTLRYVDPRDSVNNGPGLPRESGVKGGEKGNERKSVWSERCVHREGEGFGTMTDEGGEPYGRYGYDTLKEETKSPLAFTVRDLEYSGRGPSGTYRQLA